MVQNSLRSIVLGMTLIVSAACGEQEAQRPEYTTAGQFDTTAVEIITATDTIVVRAEVAANDDQRALGLMERRQLGANEGMIFVYDTVQGAESAFWMFRTRIPLDIAFVDSTGTIVAIRSMAPCESPYPQSCPPYAAGARFQSALEVNQGFFEQHRIGVGDRVRVR